MPVSNASFRSLAISALLTTLHSGDHIVVSSNVYGGTFRLLEQVLDRYGLRASWVNTSDLPMSEKPTITPQA